MLFKRKVFITIMLYFKEAKTESIENRSDEASCFFLSLISGVAATLCSLKI
jgi:hypothetical protein